MCDQQLADSCASVLSVQVQEEAALQIAQLGRAAWPSSPDIALGALELVVLLGFKKQSARSRRPAISRAVAATADVLEAMLRTDADGAELARDATAVKAMLAQLTASVPCVTFQDDA